MTELAKALEAGAEELKSRSENPMSLAAGCELFIAFVTDLPHEIKACLRRVHVNLVAHYLTLVGGCGSVGFCRTQEGAREAGPDICGRCADVSREDRPSGLFVHQR
jgi:hypothetical protein